MNPQEGSEAMDQRSVIVPDAAVRPILELRRSIRRLESALLPPTEDDGDTPGPVWDGLLEAFEALEAAVNTVLIEYTKAAERSALLLSKG
jgi:hypothetical protein